MFSPGLTVQTIAQARVSSQPHSQAHLVYLSAIISLKSWTCQPKTPHSKLLRVVIALASFWTQHANVVHEHHCRGQLMALHISLPICPTDRQSVAFDTRLLSAKSFPGICFTHFWNSFNYDALFCLCLIRWFCFVNLLLPLLPLISVYHYHLAIIAIIPWLVFFLLFYIKNI